jgi:CHAT domain-containing protein
MLLIGEDCAARQDMLTLKNVGEELTCIDAIAKSSKFCHAVEVIGSNSTAERVSHCLESASFVHLACHGVQDDNSLESGFYLGDGKLTVSKLMDLKLNNAWFAYLSACETAKGDKDQPDQVIHLAAAMLFAGFKSVVATMW